MSSSLGDLSHDRDDLYRKYATSLAAQFRQTSKSLATFLCELFILFVLASNQVYSIAIIHCFFVRQQPICYLDIKYTMCEPTILDAVFPFCLQHIQSKDRACHCRALRDENGKVMLVSSMLNEMWIRSDESAFPEKKYINIGTPFTKSFT